MNQSLTCGKERVQGETYQRQQHPIHDPAARKSMPCPVWGLICRKTHAPFTIQVLPKDDKTTTHKSLRDNTREREQSISIYLTIATALPGVGTFSDDAPTKTRYGKLKLWAHGTLIDASAATAAPQTIQHSHRHRYA